VLLACLSSVPEAGDGPPVLEVDAAFRANGRRHTAVERSAEKRGRLADLSKPVRLDLCRHSYASTMVAAGVDPGEVMRRMGHSTIALALDRYTHALRGNEADTGAKLQAFIERSRRDSHGTVEHCRERF
jgi:integrase